ncbi:MAG: VIT and VWA domain-containing protein [Armatimonadota bacterium]|nr:VIT and VWA domain-containing protein [bacterium]
MMKVLVSVVLIAVVVCAAATLNSSNALATANPLETPITPGELVITGTDGKPAGACPLKHTDVDAQIIGFCARVNVVQEFFNPTKEKIEAVYTFPLPEDAAVDRMEMTVGKRTIVGEIHRREEAREIYEAAKEAGHVASLLDQERPNIFTQSVANIMPGEKVEITISYTQLLKYEDSTYEFVFPMVVGPRFIPGIPTACSGTGREPDTDQVPDASKITAPITPKGTRAGHDISVRVEIDAGIPIAKAWSESHEVDCEFPDQSSSIVTLKDQSVIPNKDFVLKYDVAGDQITSGLITSAPTGNGGFFALIMQPPKSPKPQSITPKEMVFVIDTSGSQQGEPLAKSKETMIHCIRNMNPGDTFNMISFSSDVKKLFDTPQPFNSTNEQSALRYLDECNATGGTMMLPAVKTALDASPDSNRLRVVVFFTDGYIGNDFEVIDYIQKHSGNARMFPFGIGSSVNRFLIEKMAEAGRGAAQVVLLNSDSKGIAEKFYERIHNPLLTDISVDWNGLPIQVDEVYPKAIPDLFGSTPLVMKGRYTGPASGEIIVHGRVNGRAWSQAITVTLPAEQLDNDGIIPIWARAKVDDLMSQDWIGAQTGNPMPDVKEAITDVALDYNLVTQYTSFVAVEKMVVTFGGTPRTVAVPVEMPEGVSYEGVLGKSECDSIVGQAANAKCCYFACAPSPANGSYSRLEEKAATKSDAKTPGNHLNTLLTDLIAKYKKSGKSSGLSIPGKLIVKNGKVEVMIWVKSCEHLTKLKKLGLSGNTWAVKDKILLGWLPIGKLEAAALLNGVTRIAPPDYSSNAL